MAIRRTLPIVLIYLALLAVPEGGIAQTAVPFHISNQNPLTQVYGLPAAEEAFLSPQGHTSLRLSVDAASHFETASAQGESLFLDGESYRFTLAVRYGLSDRAEVGLDLPYLMHRGGFLDGFVEDFHETFGLAARWRNRLPRNQLLFHYQRQGTNELLLDDPVEGVGDIRLTAAWQLLRTENDAAALALRGSLKLPTGDSDRLLGSGGTDMALWITASRLWPTGREFGLFGSGGVLVMAEGDVLPELQRKLVGFGTLGIGWRPWRPLVLKLQFDGHTPFYRDSALEELTDPALQGTLGFTFCFTPDTSLDLAVVEDLAWDTSPDVVFHLALLSRF